MKIDIKYGLDIYELGRSIQKYKVKNGQTPYLFMNEKTRDEIRNTKEVVQCELATSPYISFIRQIRDYEYVLEGFGYNIYIDNNLEYGEVELR